MIERESVKRRDFLLAGGFGTLAAVLPKFIFARGEIKKGKIVKGRKVNIAGVGVGGKGKSDVNAFRGENIVALCDVDYRRGLKSFESLPKAKRYKDFRQMLIENEDKIDAVSVSTPDHMHFPPALMAIKMGKHVFVQKPLCHTVEEARILTEEARKHDVITVMGNQGHCKEGIRLVREWVQGGYIGKVREAHVWTNRPVWPQGIKEKLESEPIPDLLDWNRWLGVAPVRPYNSGYLPFNWRGWWDFGCGALGDMACHTMDATFWSLDLLYPDSVIARTSGLNTQTAPKKAKITYEFPARGDMPPVTVTWYDGGKKPPRPKDLEKKRRFKADTGQYIVGEKGTILAQDDYCTSPRIIPESRMEEVKRKRPPKTIPRVKGGPHQEWIRAIKGKGPKPGSNFDYAGPFTETVLMGNLAVRFPKQKIKWDGKNMKCTNLAKANDLIRKKYRVF